MKIPSLLVRYFTNIAAAKLESTVTQALRPVGPYLKFLAIGIGLLLGAFACYAFALLFFAGSLFFLLALVGSYALAAAQTGIVFLVIGVIFMIIGITLLGKRPGEQERRS